MIRSPRQISTPHLALLCAALAVATLADGAWSQPGTVLSFSKINHATMAAVGATIDDGDEFGDAVAGLGDLDGPGPSVAALAVGAINDDDGGSHLGAVYILFLDAQGAVMSHQKISSTQGNFTGILSFGDELGGAITHLGDLDGPGPSVAAIAVGAINDDDGGIDRGAIYILFLNSSGRVIAQQKISDLFGGFTAVLDDHDEFGSSVASLGDLDGAGPSAVAVAVGSVYDDDGGLDRGAVYILFLSATGTVMSHQKISSTSGAFLGALGDGDNFGEDVASLGDHDGPGGSARAIAISAVGDDDGGTDRGSVYVVFLNSNGTIASRQKISDTQGNFTATLANDDNFGTSVIGLGDLDGPGPSVGALGVSSAGHDGLGLDRGATYILLLDATGKVLSYQEISSSSGNFAGQLDDTDEFGCGLASVGDLDGGGPGAQFMAVGSGVDDDGGPDRGAVYLFNLSGPLVVGVGDGPFGPRAEGLGPARPSVFFQQTTIPYRLGEAGRVRIEVWDAAGRLVRRLPERDAGPGEHQAIWDGADDTGRPAAPGAYFLRMSVGGRAVAGGTKALRLR
jgi:hypothetical protein